MSERKHEYMARSIQLFPEGEGPIRAFVITRERNDPHGLPFDKWLSDRAADGWELVSLTPRGDLHHDIYVVLRRLAPP